MSYNATKQYIRNVLSGKIQIRNGEPIQTMACFLRSSQKANRISESEQQVKKQVTYLSLSMSGKNLFIICGCNGAGKTTASFNILPDLLNCKEFVNADEIARGLSPFQPEAVAIEAGRIMLNRIDELLESGINFSFETTLSTRSFVKTIEKAKTKGYFVTLIYFWLESTDLAKDRVKKRVQEGGHSISNETIERRYKGGIRNLFHLYLNRVDYLLIFDNSISDSELIAEKELNNDFTILNFEKFNQIKSMANE